MNQQTLRPKRVILVDDGSTDRTIELASAFCRANDINLIAIQRKSPIGKTPTLKRQSRELVSDVEFILDGDTILESTNYIERVVEELYKGSDIASACGTVLPMRRRNRQAMLNDPALYQFLKARPDVSIYPNESRFKQVQKEITNLYRDVLYLHLQKFLYPGQMAFYGSMLNPVGCAVAYRRSVLKSLVFDHYEPLFGDDLTNSEDIFIGFALNEYGFRNVQLTDVYARSQDPIVSRLPRQVYLWSSSFLQSCYYFDDLMRSPFKALRRAGRRKRERQALTEGRLVEKRAHAEAFRQPFGIDYARRDGRPIGWVLLLSAFEKIFFPTALLIMLLLQLWEPLLITILAETALSLFILGAVSKGQRLENVVKGLAVVPVRYGLILFDVVTISRFAKDLWISKNRNWRK